MLIFHIDIFRLIWKDRHLSRVSDPVFLPGSRSGFQTLDPNSLPGSKIKIANNFISCPRISNMNTNVDLNVVVISKMRVGPPNAPSDIPPFWKIKIGLRRCKNISTIWLLQHSFDVIGGGFNSYFHCASLVLILFIEIFFGVIVVKKKSCKIQTKTDQKMID